MKVRELIAKLQEFDGEFQVKLVDGDLESKATTAGTPAIDLKPVKENEDKKWWSELPKTLWNHFKENFPKNF
jgi:hypothetical protein